MTRQTKQRNWQPIIHQLEAVVGQAGVVRRREELLVYECDGLTSYRQRPAVVVLPRTTEAVAGVVEICDRAGIPFVARGSGTGLSGGALPLEDGVLIVTALMREILKVDLDNQLVVVQPGVFVGSEGTLGIATEITLRLIKAPEAIQVLLADFTSVEAAATTVTDITKAGIMPAGMEMMDNLSINAVEDVVATGCYPRDAAAILLVELDGLTSEVAIGGERVAALCRRNGAREVVIATDPDQRLKLWKGRKAAFAAAGNLSPDYYVQDGVIPRTQLAQVLQAIEALGQRYGYRIANVFHAGDGNLHPLILYNKRDPGALEAVETLGGEILKLCVRCGGSISGEHGIGADKRCYMPDMFSAADLETMQWVRQAFDPKRLANPDKIFPTPRTCGEGARGAIAQDFPQAELF